MYHLYTCIISPIPHLKAVVAERTLKIHNPHFVVPNMLFKRQLDFLGVFP